MCTDLFKKSLHHCFFTTLISQESIFDTKSMLEHNTPIKTIDKSINRIAQAEFTLCALQCNSFSTDNSLRTGYHSRHCVFFLSHVSVALGMAFSPSALDIALKKLSSTLSCVSVCSRAHSVQPSLNTLGLRQWQTYLKCGGCVLIKHGGIFNEGHNKRHIGSITTVLSDQLFICIMQVCFTDGVDWLHICSFVSERGVERGWFPSFVSFTREQMKWPV